MQGIKSYFNNLSLAIKIGSGFAVVSMLLLVVTGVAVLSFQSNRAVVSEVVEEYQPAVLASSQLQKKINSTAASMGFYLLSKDEIHKKNYSQGLDGLNQHIEKLNTFSVIQSDEKSQQLLESISAEIKSFAEFKERTFLYAAKDAENYPAMLFGARQINPLSQQMLQIITMMILSEEEEGVSEERAGTMKDLGDMRYAFSSVMAGIRAYLAFRTQPSLDEIELYSGQLDTVLKRFQARSELYTFEQEEGMEEFLEIKGRFFSNFKELVVIHSGEKWRMDSYMLRAEVAPLVSSIIRNAQLLAEHQNERITRASSDLFKSMDKNMFIILAVSVGALVLVVLIVLVIRQISIKPLSVTVAAMKDIAEGEGDLTRRLDASGKDEVAQLASAFNQFSDRIRDLISQSVGVADNLSEGITRLESVSQESSKGAESQREETSQVQSAIEQMILATEEVSRSAHDAVNSAEDSKSQAENGQEIVANASDAFASLASEVEIASSVIQQLQENSHSIGGMLDAIKEIAEQTNLLALNAAIEAARAGEQGRGFAVVADEVRTLASRTQNSTAEIEQIITAFKSNAAEAVEVMARGQEKAQEGVSYSNKVDETLKNITQSVNNIADTNSQIASASEEQQMVSSEIQQNVGALMSLGQKSADGAMQTQSTAAELSQFRDQLQRLMRQFKIQ